MLQTIKEAIIDAVGLKTEIENLKNELTIQKHINHNQDSALREQNSVVDLLNKKCNELEEHNRDLSANSTQMAKDLASARAQAKQYFELYDNANTSLADQKAEYECTIDDKNFDIERLKAKLQQVQGRLGAYIKKYGELPHTRENRRKKNNNGKTTQNHTAD